MPKLTLVDNHPKKPAPSAGDDINPREIIEKANDVKKEYYRINEEGFPTQSPTPSPSSPSEPETPSTPSPVDSEEN